MAFKRTIEVSNDTNLNFQIQKATLLLNDNVGEELFLDTSIDNSPHTFTLSANELNIVTAYSTNAGVTTIEAKMTIFFNYNDTELESCGTEKTFNFEIPNVQVTQVEPNPNPTLFTLEVFIKPDTPGLFPGTVTRTPSSFSLQYPEGTIVILEASANPGWNFVNWKRRSDNNVLGSLNTLEVLMDSSKQIIADFASGAGNNLSSLVVDVDQRQGKRGGAVEIYDNSNTLIKTVRFDTGFIDESIAPGTNYRLVAKPDLNNTFDTWEGSNSTNNTDLSITVNGALSFVAIFKESQGTSPVDDIIEDGSPQVNNVTLTINQSKQDKFTTEGFDFGLTSQIKNSNNAIVDTVNNNEENRVFNLPQGAYTINVTPNDDPNKSVYVGRKINNTGSFVIENPINLNLINNTVVELRSEPVITQVSVGCKGLNVSNDSFISYKANNTIKTEIEYFNIETPGSGGFQLNVQANSQVTLEIGLSEQVEFVRMYETNFDRNRISDDDLTPDSILNNVIVYKYKSSVDISYFLIEVQQKIVKAKLIVKMQHENPSVLPDVNGFGELTYNDNDDDSTNAIESEFEGNDGDSVKLDMIPRPEWNFVGFFEENGVTPITTSSTSLNVNLDVSGGDKIIIAKFESNPVNVKLTVIMEHINPFFIVGATGFGFLTYNNLAITETSDLESSFDALEGSVVKLSIEARPDEFVFVGFFEENGTRITDANSLNVTLNADKKIIAKFDDASNENEDSLDPIVIGPIGTIGEQNDNNNVT